jgi:hypothetical protein
MRLRPDRILLGEIDVENTTNFLRLINTGHDGSFATIHANTIVTILSLLSISLNNEFNSVVFPEPVPPLTKIVFLSLIWLCEGIKRAFKIMKNLSALLSKNLEILAPYLKKKNIVELVLILNMHEIFAAGH